MTGDAPTGEVVTLHRRAPWGPLELEVADDRVRARVPDSPLVEIACPSGHAFADRPLLDLLQQGVPVTFDGDPTLTLVQPRRGLARRRDRVIEVHGPAEVVPARTVLRARGYFSMGMEVAGDPTRPLVTPPFDLFDAPYLGGFTIGTPTVDPVVGPGLLATWGAASWHLLRAVQR